MVAAANAGAIDPAVSSSYQRSITGGIHYCAGGNCLAMGKRRIRGVDRRSFRPISEDYAVDRHRAYYQGEELVGANPERLVSSGRLHAVDGEWLYIRDHRVQEIDVDSARYLPRHYVVDRNRAYYGEFDSRPYVLRQLHAARPEQLRLLREDWDTWASDGHNLYQRENRIPIELSADFQLLPSSTPNLLVFVNNGELHSLGLAPHHDDPPMAAHFPLQLQALGRSQLVRYQGVSKWHGNTYWGLIDEHLLVVLADGRIVPVREGVTQLQLFDSHPLHAIADGQLLYWRPWPEPPADLGKAQLDLRFLDNNYLRNGGIIHFRHQVVIGADVDSFAPARGNADPPGIDAVDAQWRYRGAERVQRDDNALRRRNQR